MSEQTHRIHRHNYETNFTILPNDLWEHEHLSFGAKALMGYLLSRPKNWVARRPHLAKIYKGQKKGNGADSINGWFKELIEFGYIVYTPQCQETGRFVHRYDVYPDPQEKIPAKKEKLKKCQPETVKPRMGKTPTGQNSHITRKETPTRTEFDKDTYREDLDKQSGAFQSAMPSSNDESECVLGMARKFGLKDSQLDSVAFLCQQGDLGSKPETICWWSKQHSFSRIQEVVRYARSRGVKGIGGYINNLLKTGAVINESNVLENTELAQFYKKELGKNIDIMKKYVKINHSNGYVEEVPLTLDPKTFMNLMNTKLGDFMDV